MDDLQYIKSFIAEGNMFFDVLNLVINGWPSIHGLEFHIPNVS